MRLTKEELIASKVVIVIRDGVVEDVFVNDEGAGCVVLDFDNYKFDEICRYEKIVDKLRRNQKMQNIY